MLIIYLGHAGFCVETSKSIIIMDPWLSSGGAFDSAWFQYPCNHHLAAFVQRKFEDSSKDRYLYISHEHKDHFDLQFLNTLAVRDFRVIIPRFHRQALFNLLADYDCKRLITCGHRDKLRLSDGYLQIYVDDLGLNRDSAILVYSNGNSFLNLNDCKLHDQLQTIIKDTGAIDVFTCQFSGATWHPVCYDYPEDMYRTISERKMISKFESVAHAIETVKPRLYLPSAGPPCFLDPALFHINLEPTNIFPRPPKLIAYLEKRLRNSWPVYTPEVMPGDVIDVGKCDFAYKVPQRVSENRFAKYVKGYAAKHRSLFRMVQSDPSQKQLIETFSGLRRALQDKLSAFTATQRLERPLYVQFQDAPDRIIRVDFKALQVDDVSEIPSQNYYLLTAPSSQIARVVNGEMTWEDFALTFRMRLSRQPDDYETLVQGFLLLESEDIPYFCERLNKIESTSDRINVRAGARYYCVDRLCPHQGAELSQGWIENDRYLVCSRHGWRFDLFDRGRCASGYSINAVPVEEDS